jgi:hypothetical protein
MITKTKPPIQRTTSEVSIEITSEPRFDFVGSCPQWGQGNDKKGTFPRQLTHLIPFVEVITTLQITTNNYSI